MSGYRVNSKWWTGDEDYRIRETHPRIGDQFCIRWPVWAEGTWKQSHDAKRPICFEILRGEVVNIGKTFYVCLMDDGRMKRMQIAKFANLCGFRRLREGERCARQIVPD